MSATLRIHIAAWVVPVSSPPLANGAVAIQDGKILAVDSLEVLQKRFPGRDVLAHGQVALAPALINAHIHLELAHLAELSHIPHHGSFTQWVTKLLKKRDELGALGPLAQEAARSCMLSQYAMGVTALADIGNTSIGQSLVDDFPGTLLAFHEYLGIGESSLQKNLDRLRLEPPGRLCCGHAPYSTHPVLLTALKKRAETRKQVFPIHTAEPMAELDMLRHASGEMVDFIGARLSKKIVFQPAIGEKEGAIHYLYRLGILNCRTLCIHGIHVSDEEIEIMAAMQAKVCLCPGSNQFLAVGTAPVQGYLKYGILPALGTDSIASNPVLSLWREMSLLAQIKDAPNPALIFAMATMGGAQALGFAHCLGSLETGKNAEILCIPLSEPTPDARALMSMLVNKMVGREREVKRL